MSSLISIRFVVGWLAMCIAALITKIATLGHDLSTPMAQWRREIAKFGCWQASKIIFGSVFVLNPDYEYVDVDYTEFLGPGWKKTFEGASTVVCNHSTFADIVLHMQLQEPSSIGKASVAKIPIVGTIAKGVGSLFVDRGSKDDKKNFFNTINLRQK